MGHLCSWERSLAPWGGPRDTHHTSIGDRSLHCRQTGSGPSSAILDPGGRHFALGLNEPNGEHLCRSRWITCVAGKGHVPPWRGSRDTSELEVGLDYVTLAKTEVGPPAPSWIPPGAVLARGRCHFGSGLNEPVWEHLEHLWWTGHVTHLNQKWGGLRDHRQTVSGPSGAILSQGSNTLAQDLMSLMGTTCLGLARSRVWRGRSLAPLWWVT